MKAKLLKQYKGFPYKVGDIVNIKQNNMPKETRDYIGRYVIDNKENRSPPIKEDDIEILSSK